MRVRQKHTQIQTDEWMDRSGERTIEGIIHTNIDGWMETRERMIDR